MMPSGHHIATLETGDLARRRKGDKHKRKIALRLRRETTMTWEWIAQRLEMGAAGYAANCVRALNQEPAPALVTSRPPFHLALRGWQSQLLRGPRNPATA